VKDSSLTLAAPAVAYSGMLLDEFLPVYEVSDAVATVVEADRSAMWDGLMQVDLIEVG
jgi:hypothetical protein